jgi:hypothetical protein
MDVIKRILGDYRTFMRVGRVASSHKALSGEFILKADSLSDVKKKVQLKCCCQDVDGDISPDG